MIVTVVALLAGAVAAVTLFTQTAPPVTVTPPIVASNCAALVASPSSVLQGTSGVATFACTGKGAVHVSAAGSATPTFSIASTGYSDLYLFPSLGAPASTCGTTTGAVPLTSGAAVSFVSANVDWSYCADFANAQALAGWTISWSQP